MLLTWGTDPAVTPLPLATEELHVLVLSLVLSLGYAYSVFHDTPRAAWSSRTASATWTHDGAEDVRTDPSKPRRECAVQWIFGACGALSVPKLEGPVGVGQAQRRNDDHVMFWLPQHVWGGLGVVQPEPALEYSRKRQIAVRHTVPCKSSNNFGQPHHYIG